MAGKSNVRVTSDKLSDEITKRLNEFDAEVIDAMKKGAKVAAQETNKEIKNHITFTQRSGDYVHHFAVKKVSEGYASIEYDWYVKSPDYRLTHLLEKGHKLVKKWRTIGQVKAFPHIKYGEAVAKQKWIEEIEKELN